MRFSLSTRCSVFGCLALGCLLSALVGTSQTSVAQEPDAAKPTIKDVMKSGHKDGLLKKILDGDATQQEKQELLDLYITMFELKPEKGDIESWQRLAGGAALAAAKVVVGRPDGLETLKVATNCKACHDPHK
ncbi:MAG: hypothetical protein EA381_08430 [Planctomycetaceae bacterium]|nr:MAG: hypothetical protein EA381_08430 [Planctomycetaceae bacterium]